MLPVEPRKIDKTEYLLKTDSSKFRYYSSSDQNPKLIFKVITRPVASSSGPIFSTVVLVHCAVCNKEKALSKTNIVNTILVKGFFKFSHLCNGKEWKALFGWNTNVDKLEIFMGQKWHIKS